MSFVTLTTYDQRLELIDTIAKDRAKIENFLDKNSFCVGVKSQFPTEMFNNGKIRI